MGTEGIRFRFFIIQGERDVGIRGVGVDRGCVQRERRGLGGHRGCRLGRELDWFGSG